MKMKFSGRFPDLIKKFVAAAVILAAALNVGCSCAPNEPNSSDVLSIVSTSVDNSTHVPIEDSSDGESGGNASDSSDNSDSQSIESGDSSKSVSESSDKPPDISSEIPSETISNDNPSESVISEPEPVVSEPEPVVSEPEPVVSEPEPVVSEPEPVVSEPESVVSEPEPVVSEPEPVVVTIPNFPVPTSPGIDCSAAADGMIDYSNAAQGYISARYTGSKSKVKLQISCGGVTETHDVSPNGITEYYPLMFGSGNYEATLFELRQGTRYTPVTTCAFAANLSDSTTPFMYSNHYSEYNSGSACVYKAAELCAGKTGTIEKIAAIFGWVTENVTYDYGLAATVEKGYVPNPERTFNSRTGICFDYASLMCAMLRSQLIPTRLVVGNASPDIYHAWNEVYTEETGWITPELMLKNAGYNIADSTFYASSSDKSQISSYISNPANYQALHYY